MSNAFEPSMRHACPDCGVYEGDFHRDHCDSALCRRCGWQLSTCPCQGTKHHIRYVAWPIRCARCGMAWPAMFHVSDKAWRETVQKNKRDSILCLDCFMVIRSMLGLPACPWKPFPKFANAIEALAYNRQCSLEEAKAILQAIADKYPSGS